METLNLSGSELEEMKAFYQDELTRTIAKLNHITKVLDQLGGKSASISVTVEGGATTSRSAPAAQPRKRKGKKRGPKSVWGSFILKRLQQLDKPLTYNDLVDEAMVFFKLSDQKRQTVVNAINNSAFRLRRNSGRIDTFSAGGREKFVALRSWFDASGKILPEYKKKVNKPKKKQAKKSTRKAKAAPKARTPKRTGPSTVTGKSAKVPSVKVKSADKK